jgi:hypothetical protein
VPTRGPDNREHRTLAACADDAAFLIKAVPKKVLEPLTGQMSNRLLGVLAAEQQKSDVGIGESIFDHPLNA